MITPVENGSPTERDEEEDDVSWYRGLSNDLGDIVPGLNLDGQDGDTAAGHKRTGSKVKRHGQGKGRKFGKFGRRGRKSAPKKTGGGRVMRAGPNETTGSKQADTNGVEMAGAKQANLEQPEQSATLNSEYVEEDMNMDL